MQHHCLCRKSRECRKVRFVLAVHASGAICGGKVMNLTGRDQPYEAPEDADLVLHTAELTAEQAADRVVELVMRRGDCGTSPNSATR